jgi:hypothetical protein
LQLPFLVLGGAAQSINASPVDCDFGFFGLRGSASIKVDTVNRELEILGSVIPIAQSIDDTLIAFWATEDGRQFLTFAFNRSNRVAAITRVGTKEPFLRTGRCFE